MLKSSEETQSQDFKTSSFNDIRIFNKSTTETSNSQNKDEIIDDYQEKMGEILKARQDLCSENNRMNERIIILQNQLDQEKHISSQIPQLQKNLSAQTKTISELNNKIKELNETNESLNINISELKQKIQEINQNSEKEIERRVVSRTSELQSLIEIKDNEIQSLKQQIEDLKKQNSTNNESIMKEKIEKERLTVLQAEKEKENLQFKDEINKLTSKFKSIKEKHLKEKENNKNLMINLGKFQSEIIKYKEKEKLAKERNNKIEKNLHDARSIIKQILNIRNPPFDTIDELVLYINQKNEENSLLKNEIKNQKKVMKKFALAIQKYDEKVSLLNENILNTKNVESTLKTNFESQSKQIERLSNKLQVHKRKLAIIPVYEKITADLRHRLQEILSIVRPETPDVTVRSLTIFVIMLRRWRSLLGISPKTYVFDSRNWWWMNTPESQKLTSYDLNYLIGTLKGEAEKYKKLSDHLQYQIQQYDLQLKESQNSADKSTKTIRYNAKRIVELESQIGELQKKVQIDVKESDDYQEMTKKLKNAEIELHEAQDKLRENQVEISDLQIDLCKTKQQLSNQSLLTKQREKALEDTKYQLYRAQNGLTHLKQGNRMRTKEILALERGIQKEQKKAASSNTQNAILTLENRRMNFQISNQNGDLRSNSPDHQFVEQPVK